jgi:ubiquitin C-terminal hydrolase
MDPFAPTRPFNALRASPPPQNQDLLAAFVQREELQDSERYRCDRCGPDKKQPASKRLQIWSYPPNTLVLTLKRFSSSGGGGGAIPSLGAFGGRFSAARKVATPVLLQPAGALDLRPYCNPRGLKECVARGCPAPVYRLVAVANHSGTLGGGGGRG